MEDEIDLIKRREEEDVLASSLDMKIPNSIKKVGFDSKVEGACRATLPWSNDGLDRSGHLLCEKWTIYPKEADCPMGHSGGNRPKRGKDRSSKPRRVLINRKQREPKSYCPSTKKAGSVINPR
ncbi:hypothetical protein Ancab_017281, partial [Ancistrocladus abbreviatus]